MAGSLWVAAGYGLAASVLLVLMIEIAFGEPGTATRMAVLAASVGLLVTWAAVAGARRSWHGRHPRN